MPKRRTYKLTRAIDRIEKEVRGILSTRQSSRYFEGLVLMYSMIENVLKWLVFVKVLWNKSDRVLRARELASLKTFCNRQDFYSALNLALVTGLLDYSLFRQIDEIRKERNDILHQAYLFTHRRNQRVLRAKLRKIVSSAEQLFVVFNNLIAETGADDSYDIFKVNRGRQMIG